MAKPENVTTKFDIEKILYNSDGFAIAYGESDDIGEGIAMRWNGKDGELGFPQSYGNPVWFFIARFFFN
jgi:hypothetical protein